MFLRTAEAVARLLTWAVWPDVLRARLDRQWVLDVLRCNR
jgi:hypothetical protein